MKKTIDVSVIIVNYNTRDLLRNCLKSIFERTEEIVFEVIVSDNGSNDGSIEMLQTEFPAVILIENKENLGFGSANNRGLDVAQGEFIFYLNSDTLLLNNAIKLFCDYWRNHIKDALGALGCNLLNAEGILTESYGDFPRNGTLIKNMNHHLLAFYAKNVLKFLNKDFSRFRPIPKYQKFLGKVDYVVGADLFVRNVPQSRFDENFFLYFEETDLQWRMSKAGLKMLLIDGPKIVHLIRGGRAKCDDVIRYGSFSMIQSEISKVRYAKKNLSTAVALLLKILITIQWLSPYIFKNTRKYLRTLWSI